LHVIASIDDETSQAYLVGYLVCPQFSAPRRVRFYIDSGSTITTLLSIDVVRLNLRWSHLKQTICETAIGQAEPFVLPSVFILLKTIENQIEQLKSYPLNAINLLPPEDPCSVYPAQYEFAFSLLGMDVLKAFKTWEWDYQSKQLILK